MLKLLITLLSVNTLFAYEDKISKILLGSINNTKAYKVLKVDIYAKEKMRMIPNWEVLHVEIDLEIVDKNRTISIKDIVFTNGKVMTRDFIDINTGKSIKETE